MTDPVVLPPYGQPWTIDDLHRLPDDGQRYEIFDGSLLVSPPPDVRRGAVAYRLRRLLERYAPAELVVANDIGVAVSRRSTYFVPDLFVADAAVLDRRSGVLAADDLLLVIEVLSPANAGRDLLLKRHEYAAAGIPGYWIVDYRARTLTVLNLVDGDYHETVVVRPGEAWRTGQPFPLTLDPAEFV